MKYLKKLHDDKVDSEVKERFRINFFLLFFLSKFQDILHYILIVLQYLYDKLTHVFMIVREYIHVFAYTCINSILRKNEKEKDISVTMFL